jgi:hypothetical protein
LRSSSASWRASRSRVVASSVSSVRVRGEGEWSRGSSACRAAAAADQRAFHGDGGGELGSGRAACRASAARAAASSTFLTRSSASACSRAARASATSSRGSGVRDRGGVLDVCVSAARDRK